MKRRNALLWFPVAVLLTVYVAICVRYCSMWPWRLVVHEDGRHTLWGTVFYFEHALGELPLEWLLALSVAGAVLWYAGEGTSRHTAGLAVAAVGLDLWIVAGAWLAVGPLSSLAWLLQYRTREGEPLLFGSHWRYHLLSQAALMLLALALAASAGASRGARRAPLLWASSAGFAALTAFFGWSAAPFGDARYLGHEARETWTHALVTVPLATGLCLRMAGRSAKAPRMPRSGWWALGGFALLAVYQGGGAMLTGSRSRAQSNDLVSLLCVHFFEHVFSYLVVAAHAALFYAVAGRTSARRSVGSFPR